MNMKRSVALCGIILGVSLLGSAVQAETVERAMNFRSGPSVSGSLIGSVPKGAAVTVLDSQNGWDYINYNGVKGWIHGGNTTDQPVAQTDTSSTDTTASAAATSGAATSTAATSAGQSVKVLYGMNFRATPGMDGRIMGGVPAGTTVQYLDSSNGWDKIIYNGVTGWIASGRTTAATTTEAASTSAAAAASASTSTGQSVKVLYGMNFRATPGMDGRIMDGIPAGTTVQYLGSSNGWDKVVFNGVTGWIASGRTTSVSTATQAAATTSTTSTASTAGTTKTVTTTMNFRATGALTGSLIGLVPTGSKVIYVTSANGWEQIIYNGQTGWIKGGNTQ